MGELVPMRTKTLRVGADARFRRLRVQTVATVGAVGLAVAGGAVALAPSSQALSPVTVSVDASAVKGVIPEAGAGVNVGVGDERMNEANVPGILKNAGVRALRYPGGSIGDAYHWKDSTAPGWWVAANTSFDQFMTTA